MRKFLYFLSLCCLCLEVSTVFAQDSLLDSIGRGEQGNLILDQPPNQSNGLYIDLDCDACGSGTQVIGENFSLPANNTLGQFVIYTGYHPGNVPINDTWDLTVHNDNSGVPGTIAYTESDVSATRTDTGVDLFGVDEYRVVLTPSSSIPLTAGTYWVEIHNDSTGSTDNVFWEIGDTGTNSLAGNAFATQYPAVTWNTDNFELAIQICQEAFDLDVNVTGLAATNSLTVANDKDVVVVSSNGTTKVSGLSDGTAYNLSITQQPDTPNQVCSVTSGNASGSMTSSGVTIDINCVTTQYDVNINVTGLAATNSVSFSNGGDSLTINADGTQTISTLDDESAYDVDITAQPDTPNQVCSFDSPDAGSLAGSDVTINVSCVTTQYTVGVDVSGLAAGNSVVFQNNGGDNLNVSANGISTFATALDDGSAYNVTVLTQPTSPNQTCVIASPTGNLNGSNVSLNVTCTTEQYNIHVNVSGLAAGNDLVLQNNGADDLSINANGNSTFATALDDGSAYDVTVLTQPTTPNQNCDITNGSGNLAGNDVTVDVTCTIEQYTISVDVSGLAIGNDVVLQNNGSDDLTISSNGSSTFATALDDETDYLVSVLTQPSAPNQTCVLANESGTVAGANVTDITLTCTTEQYDIVLNVSGLAATNNVSFANGVDTATFNSDGSQTITTADDGTAYDIDITTQPNTPDQVCSFDDADTGNISGDDVTINVTCEITQYDINVDVSGLAAGNSVILQNNGGDDLTINSNGISTFSNPLDDGTNYAVTIVTQPISPNQTCVVTNGTGTVAGSDVNNINVTCTTDTYFVGGTVTGMLNVNEIILDNNMQETALVSCNGPFVFNTPLDDLSTYDVTVLINPDSPAQDCEVFMGNGTIDGDDVIDVEVVCAATTSTDYIYGDGFDCPVFIP
jgi:hypothetical protein